MLKEFEDLRYTATCNVYDHLKHLNDEPATTHAKILAPSAMDLHTSIWRLGVELKAQAFYNEVTGAIDLAAIITSPGDFNLSQRSVTCWTPQRETTLRYASGPNIKSQL